MFSTAQWQLITFLSSHHIEWPPVLILFCLLNQQCFSTCSNVCKLLCESTVETCPPVFAGVKIAGLSPCLPPPTLCKNIPKGQRALEPLFYVSRISVEAAADCCMLAPCMWAWPVKPALAWPQVKVRSVDQGILLLIQTVQSCLQACSSAAKVSFCAFVLPTLFCHIFTSVFLAQTLNY